MTTLDHETHGDADDLPRWSVADVHESLDARSFQHAMERAGAGMTRLESLFDELGVRAVEPRPGLDALLPEAYALAVSCGVARVRRAREGDDEEVRGAEVPDHARRVVVLAQDHVAVRDRLDAAYPGYGFATHKGYPTREHLEALRRRGPCDAHRRSYAPVQAALRGTAP